MLIPPAPRAQVAPRLQLCSFVAKGVAPLPWVEFKIFLRKSQFDSRVFVYITWSRIRQDSQYQQEEVLHWASHLEHPQSIEFDADRAPEKPDLNRFFRKGDGEEGWRGRMTRKDNDFFPYALVSLRTHLSTHLSPYALVSPLRLCTNRKNIPRRYLSEIVHLLRHAVCHPRLSQYVARKLSCRLDAIDAPPLCGSQPHYQYWPE